MKPPLFRNPLHFYQFTRKSFLGNGLPQSGSASLIPVVPGCGGRAPGQNLDKFWATQNQRPLPSPFPPGPLAPLQSTSCAGTRRRRPSANEDDNSCSDDSQPATLDARLLPNLSLRNSTGIEANGDQESGRQGHPGLNAGKEQSQSALSSGPPQTASRPRRREEIQRERRALVEKTQKEIDQIAAEFHTLLSPGEAKAIGTIYARYSSRHQDSVADQVRKCFEKAVRERIYVPREFVCFDLAARGCKDKRSGLNDLRDLLDQ